MSDVEEDMPHTEPIKEDKQTTVKEVDDTWRTMDWNNDLWNLWLKKESLKALLRIAQALETINKEGIYAYEKI